MLKALCRCQEICSANLRFGWITCNPTLFCKYTVLLPRKYRISMFIILRVKTLQYDLFWYNKGIHLYLPPPLWAEFLSQCEDISLIIWFSSPVCDSHLKGKSKNLQYVRVPIFPQILDICWVHSIQFLFSFQKYKCFWNRTKIDVLTMFFPWNYFLCGRIPSFLENGKQNVKVLCEEFRCHLILWVTMWAEFYSHCDSHYEKIVSRDEYLW